MKSKAFLLRNHRGLGKRSMKTVIWWDEWVSNRGIFILKIRGYMFLKKLWCCAVGEYNRVV